MAHKIPLAFDPQAFVLPLDQILPLKIVNDSMRSSEKYKCIAASLQEIGLIEPLIVYPQQGSPKRFLLLDGAIRLDIFKSRGEKEAFCLRATEEEALTYNHKVNQLSPIQEHFMIMRALDSGVSEDRIAVTLHVDIAAIRKKRDLLNGICAEAVEMLRDKRISPSALREVRRVAPLRQVEMAELMIAANNYSASYAKCLYTATPDEQKLPDEMRAEDHGVPAQDAARMQREMAALHREIKLIEESHGENMLNLVPTVGYLRKFLGNPRIERYLRSHHGEILTELRKIVDEPELSAGNDKAA